LKTLAAELLTAQVEGYPTGGYQPAINCVLTSKDGLTTYDYSFVPTSTTNRLIHAEQTEHVIEGDRGVLLFSNYDNAVPSDLRGYYVDIGWGMNTSDGLKYTGTAFAPRLWVMRQQDVSGSAKGEQPGLFTVLELEGAKTAILDRQLFRLGNDPTYRDETGLLAGKTIYEIIEYLIETALNAQVGGSFTLEALGTQDDGQISTIIPFPIVTAGSFVSGTEYRILTVGSTDFTLIGAAANTVGEEFFATDVGAGTGTATTSELRDINADSPNNYQTYGEVINSLLELTSCTMVTRYANNFKILYPLAADTADKTYYTSLADGHPFYEAMDRKINMTPNHIEIHGGADAEYVGDWFDSDHYSTPPTRPFTPADINTAYDGAFMPVTYSMWEYGLESDGQCESRAEAEGKKLKEQILGSRVIIPMDASIELYDKIMVNNTRA